MRYASSGLDNWIWSVCSADGRCIMFWFTVHSEPSVICEPRYRPGLHAGTSTRRWRERKIRAAKRAARSELSVSKGDWCVFCLVGANSGFIGSADLRACWQAAD